MPDVLGKAEVMNEQQGACARAEEVLKLIGVGLEVVGRLVEDDPQAGARDSLNLCAAVVRRCEHFVARLEASGPEAVPERMPRTCEENRTVRCNRCRRPERRADIGVGRQARPKPHARNEGEGTAEPRHGTMLGRVRQSRSGTRSAALACVIGSIDLVRPLGLAGIRSAVVAPPGDVVRWSRFTTTALPWADPWREPDRLLMVLADFGRGQPRRPVLYYEGDWDLLLVSRERDELRRWYRFVLPERELVEDLVDKERFQALADRLELPVPGSRRLLPETAGGNDLGLRFPLVVKPLTRQNVDWEPVATGAKALVANTPDELEAVRARLADRGIQALAQEAILGPETRVESYHAYVDEEGAIVGEFAGRKVRTYPPAHGFSTALVTSGQADVMVTGRELLTRMRFRGVAKLDFKRDDTGRLWLLEVNPRFNLWHHVGARAGVNLPALVYRDLVGLPRQHVPAARVGVRWVYHRHDARAARAMGIPLYRWLRWALAADAKSTVSLDDPMPLVRGSLRQLARRVGFSA